MRVAQLIIVQVKQAVALLPVRFVSELVGQQKFGMVSLGIKTEMAKCIKAASLTWVTLWKWRLLYLVGKFELGSILSMAYYDYYASLFKSSLPIAGGTR